MIAAPRQASLVVTCCNQGRYLGEALDSALSQSVPFAEVILVDDGSTDDTTVVTARYPQVRYLHQANRGLPAARNAGLREVTGEYVVFLDARDRLTADAVEAGLACFALAPTSGFVYGSFRYMTSKGTPMPGPGFMPAPAEAYAGFLSSNRVGMHATVMYRRDALVETGGFDEFLPACQDYDVHLKLARKHDVRSHPAIVAEYRCHEANRSDDPTLMLRTVLEVLLRQEPYVGANTELRAALRQGVRYWQEHYGGRLAERALRNLSQPGRRGKGLVDLATVVRRAPRGLCAREFNVFRVAARKGTGWLPGPLRTPLWRWLKLHRAAIEPDTVPAGKVQFGDLRRLTPFSREFGYDRGLPIDRYYIERFLAESSDRVRGCVLEVGDRDYTDRFGGSKVTSSDVLNVYPGKAVTTIVADLAVGEGIPDASFDCVIVTQTLHLIYDARGAIQTLYRVLKPGGTLLLTVPGTISQIATDEWRATWCWGFTELALGRMFAEVFSRDALAMREYGNVLSSMCFLQGLAAEELTPVELDHRDPLYPLVIAVCATKPA